MTTISILSFDGCTHKQGTFQKVVPQQFFYCEECRQHRRVIDIKKQTLNDFVRASEIGHGQNHV